MKLSREALSKIVNIFQSAQRKTGKVEPSAAWQDRLMDDIRQQPPPAGRAPGPALWTALLLLLIVLLCLFLFPR